MQDNTINQSKLELSGTSINTESNTITVQLAKYRHMLAKHVGIVESENGGKPSNEILSSKLDKLSNKLFSNDIDVNATLIEMTLLVEYFEIRDFELSQSYQLAH